MQHHIRCVTYFKVCIFVFGIHRLQIVSCWALKNSVALVRE
jgi:hypothetical protein